MFIDFDSKKIALFLGVALFTSHVDAARPEFSGYLRNNETKFVKFIKNNIGKDVNLTLSFEENPYDYKGEPDLALWYTANVGFFFHCAGSWDNHTGYAEKGTLSGIWKISDVKKLGGQRHYTLICV